MLKNINGQLNTRNPLIAKDLRDSPNANIVNTVERKQGKIETKPLVSNQFQTRKMVMTYFVV